MIRNGERMTSGLRYQGYCARYWSTVPIMIATNSTAMSALMSLSIMESRYPAMKLRNCAFLSCAIKGSDWPDARVPALRERDVEKQQQRHDDANDGHQKADANTLRLPPENIG